MTPHPRDLIVTRWGARYRGRAFPCSIGSGGIGFKQGEGDGITPIGSWRIGGVAYRADRMPNPLLPMPTHAISPSDIWSDDPTDPDYNHGIVARDYPFSHERLFRADPLYDLFAVLDFNWPSAVPGAGSAIFLHSWRKPRHPTAGCVAFAPSVLLHILETWEPRSRVIIRE